MRVPEDIKKKICDRYSFAPRNSIDKFLMDNPEVDEFLTNIIISEPFFRTKRLAFSCIAKGVFEPLKCLACGKELDIYKYLNNGVQFCSRKCSQSSFQRLEKIRVTSMERYGCANAMQNREVKKKQRETNIARYGVENTFQSEKVKKKIRNTNFERYGTENYVQSSDWKKKVVATNMERLGVAFPAQNKRVMSKVKATNIKRYGGVAPACSDMVVDKIKFKNLEKYGAKFYTSSSEYFAIQHDKLVERFRGKIEPLFSAEQYHGMGCKEEYQWKCSCCGTIFSSRIYTTSFDDDEILPRCPMCHPKLEFISGKERELLEFVKSIYDGTIFGNDRSVISPKELNIYLPDKKIAIEFDGLYWHSEKGGKGESYHFEKTEECLKKGIRLVHVFEDEWKNKQDIVKSRIRSILGVNKRIFARECVVKGLSFNESHDFLDANHLQGRDNSKHHYGLYFEEELVAVMTFSKPRFNKNYDYELIRYCSKNGCNIVGGAGKLLAYFRKNHVGSIISYADRRYSNGNLYEKLGFTRIGVSKPNYWYVKNNEKLNRYQCQKHKLAFVLGDMFDGHLSELENMKNNGWSRLYDCGNLVYVLE